MAGIFGTASIAVNINIEILGLVSGHQNLRNGMTSKIALLVITDGRSDYLEQTLVSAEENLVGSISTRILVDDSGSKNNSREGWINVQHDERRGFCAAINSGWKTAAATDVDFLFHLEEDFTFNEPIYLESMAAVLTEQPHLAHITLKRQPVNSTEITNGIMGGFEGSVGCTDGAYTWTEHTNWYSTNPALVPRRTFERTFPDSSEVGFGAELFADGQKVAFWGKSTDQPRVTHIGRHRSDGWKL